MTYKYIRRKWIYRAISVNYKTISSKNDIYKVLYNRFKNGRFETLRLMYFLNSIINRDVCIN